MDQQTAASQLTPKLPRQAIANPDLAQPAEQRHAP
jgi:hypothetical protein